METTINIEEIQQKLVEQLRPSGWANKLKGFIQSSDFNRIIETLYNLKQSGKRFTPPLKDCFNAFKLCPYDNLRVVFIGQDPYPQMGVADGLAFSCSHGTAQPSLDYLLKAVESTVPQAYRDPTEHINLDRWSKQGILLLNTALTTEIGKPATHQYVWEDFMAYTLDMINSFNGGLIFVFLGKIAHEMEPLIGDQHHKFMLSHPASAYYQKSGQWECQDVFNKINDILYGQNGERIIW
jgi:uracil-DNA glycosylase